MACVRFPDDVAERRKRLIEWLGQPVRVNVDVLPWGEDFVVLTITPLHGFIHLVTDPEACIREFGAYHVSLCQRSLVSASEMAQLHRTWNGVELTLPIDHVSSDGCLELGKCALTEDSLIRVLHYHPQAWYCDRFFHISA